MGDCETARMREWSVPVRNWMQSVDSSNGLIDLWVVHRIRLAWAECSMQNGDWFRRRDEEAHPRRRPTIAFIFISIALNCAVHIALLSPTLSLSHSLFLLLSLSLCCLLWLRINLKVQMKMNQINTNKRAQTWRIIHECITRCPPYLCPHLTLLLLIFSSPPSLLFLLIFIVKLEFASHPCWAQCHHGTQRLTVARGYSLLSPFNRPELPLPFILRRTCPSCSFQFAFMLNLFS